MKRKISHCHKDIAKVAKALAEASYDELMSNNMLYEAWKKKWPHLVGDPVKLKRQYVANKWGLYVDAARATMALTLREPIDEKVKEEVVKILALDSTLIRGRVNPALVAGAVANKE